MKKQDLKSLTRNELVLWFKKRGYPEYRANQVFNWIYKNGIDDFDRMTNLPGNLKTELKEDSYITNLLLRDIQVAGDGTKKYLWSLIDCEAIESVYLPFEDRKSICISSQVGCAMDCLFCATGRGGLVRNLTTGEIVDQVFQIQKDISQEEFGLPRISNIVFMGMGEPLANLEAVLKAVDILNDTAGFDIGMRRITISTAGLVPGIIKLAGLELQLVLAISLNAPDDQLRNKLMPINKKYPLNKLLSAIQYYINKTGRRVTFEYVLIKDLNDSRYLAQQTAELLKNFLCHVNLIPLNPVEGFLFERPSNDTILNFKRILEEAKIETSIRQERGTHIEAACGQLRQSF
jgi:23S rRNA (adenine2503-C2)-methyltransferase